MSESTEPKPAEPAKDNPQAGFTPQENHGIETQAANPAITNEFGERQDEGDGGSKDDSADK